MNHGLLYLVPDPLVYRIRDNKHNIPAFYFYDNLNNLAIFSCSKHTTSLPASRCHRNSLSLQDG